VNPYIRFVGPRYTPSGKTRIWSVIATRNDALLGEIRYYGRWRQYAFFPEPNTIFNPDCMDEVSKFCREETTRQRRLSGTKGSRKRA
jgi:hypothetical protein